MHSKLNCPILTRTSAFVSAICLALLITSYTVAQEDGKRTENLKSTFKHLYPNLKKQRFGDIKLIDGPKQVTMGRGGSGEQWSLQSGKYAFKISIKNSEDVDIGIEDVIRKLEHVPLPYRKAFQVVSDKDEDGVAVYADLNGAAAHGSKDYINIVPFVGPHTITHEAGHTLDQYANAHGMNVRKLWRKAIKSDQISVSGYGDHVEHEDLAEFAQVYAACLAAGKEDLKKLKHLSPARFKVWELMLYFDENEEKNTSSKQTPASGAASRKNNSDSDSQNGE